MSLKPENSETITTKQSRRPRCRISVRQISVRQQQHFSFVTKRTIGLVRNFYKILITTGHNIRFKIYRYINILLDEGFAMGHCFATSQSHLYCEDREFLLGQCFADCNWIGSATGPTVRCSNRKGN